jgi:hypothetical protein
MFLISHHQTRSSLTYDMLGGLSSNYCALMRRILITWCLQIRCVWKCCIVFMASGLGCVPYRVKNDYCKSEYSILSSSAELYATI